MPAQTAVVRECSHCLNIFGLSRIPSKISLLPQITWVDVLNPESCPQVAKNLHLESCPQVAKKLPSAEKLTSEPPSLCSSTSLRHYQSERFFRKNLIHILSYFESLIKTTWLEWQAPGQQGVYTPPSSQDNQGLVGRLAFGLIIMPESVPRKVLKFSSVLISHLVASYP